MLLSRHLRWDAPASLGPATLVAGVGGGASHTGYSGGAGSAVGNGVAFGSLSDTSAPGGRTIAALYWDSGDLVSYLVLFGTTHAAFLTGLQIWINGTLYTCGAGGVYIGVSYAQVAASNIFVSGSSYSVSFTAPSGGAVATANGALSLTGAATAAAPATAAASGVIALSGAGAAGVQVAAQAAGAIGLSGAGAAAVVVGAQAAGAIDLTGSAAASGAVAGASATAAATLSLTGAAAAVASVAAQAAGGISLSGAGAGASAVRSQAAGVVALTGSAAAGAAAQGQAAGAITLSGSSAGMSSLGPVVPPAGVFPDDQAALDVVTHFNAGLSTGSYVRTASGYTVTGAASLVFTLPSALTGNYWVSYGVTEEQPGSHRAGYLSPSYTPNALRSRGRNQVFNTPAVAGSTQVRIITGSGFAGEIEDIQLVDMATYLTWPADVWVAWWQSNMAATTQSLGYDKTQDAWADPRLQCFPGAANTQHGTTLGEITALRSPMQMQSNVAEALNPGMISAGVSPAVNFARNILPKVAAGRRLVVIAAAVSGTGIEGPAAAWNPASSNPFAYNHMMSLTAQAMAALPAGSVIRGMIGAGGESDTSADMSTHSAALNAVLVASGNAWVSAGYCATRPPCVLIGPPPDASRANQAVLVACHAKLDRDSGDATSIANVHVAPTGNWGCEDSTHRTAAASRLAGIVAANLVISRGLMEQAASSAATAAATISLTGSGAGRASASAVAGGIIPLSGGAIGSVPAAAQAGGTVALSGAAAAAAAVTAQAGGGIALAGSGAATGGVAGITATVSGTLSLSGVAAASSAVAAAAQGAITLGGQAAAALISQAQASAVIALTNGAAAARAEAAAQLAGILQIAGSAIAGAPARAVATAGLTLAGSGASFALLQAIAAGTISLIGMAAAERPGDYVTGRLVFASSGGRRGVILNGSRQGRILNAARRGTLLEIIP